eukprot:TRINITY_DN5948_c0_g2_i1.p1 TRINITY_DN5948_c0_g2~~TRINITY_DN5948_c0_g2_i1.p1  ORF type:complete len:174 (+),score=36.59 TRINITY_DN5948_c0_g2_i1:52-573(+)
MANHGPRYGLSADVKQKRAATYDTELEGRLKTWIEAVVGIKLNPPFQKALQDGVILCKLINKIRPGTFKKILDAKTPFMKMENINAFLKALPQLGIPHNDCFMTVDLYEGKNMNAVLDTLNALGKRANSLSTFKGPRYEESKTNLPPQKDFDEPGASSKDEGDEFEVEVDFED